MTKWVRGGWKTWRDIIEVREYDNVYINNLHATCDLIENLKLLSSTKMIICD